jgi:hypothetical protein
MVYQYTGSDERSRRKPPWGLSRPGSLMLVNPNRRNPFLDNSGGVGIYSELVAPPTRERPVDAGWMPVAGRSTEDGGNPDEFEG